MAGRSAASRHTADESSGEEIGFLSVSEDSDEEVAPSTDATQVQVRSVL